MASRYELQAREYKLLLEPTRFTAVPSVQVANVFWEKSITPIVASVLGNGSSGRPRYEGQFNSVKVRSIRFWDTRDCVLTRASYSLRERIAIDDQTNDEGMREITLKLRMPDIFVVASTPLPGLDETAKTTLEEDIAPLGITRHDQHPRVIGASSSPISIWSRFSLSTMSHVSVKDELGELKNVFSLFPTLRYNLSAESKSRFSLRDGIEPGRSIREYVFKGARLRLGNGMLGKFSLTLWCFEPASEIVDIAEISFKCEFDKRFMPGDAARRAFRLFQAMQAQPGWRDTRNSSKTALALPARCMD